MKSKGGILITIQLKTIKIILQISKVDNKVINFKNNGHSNHIFLGIIIIISITVIIIEITNKLQ